MFWIICADELVGALNHMGQTPAIRFVTTQLRHVTWEGFHFEDLIFPLFVFIVGVSTVFSLTKAIDQGGRLAAVKRIVRRGVVLYVLGLFNSGGLGNPWPSLRLMGVLNLIAIAYVIAGVLFCFLKPRALAGVCAGLLVGYWAVMTFVPIRDIQLTKSSLAHLAERAGDIRAAALFREGGNCSVVKDSPAWVAAEKLYYSTTHKVSGVYGFGHNVANHFDFRYLPGRKFSVFFDPEGCLQIIPAAAMCLLGVLAGLLLQSCLFDDLRKVLFLLVGGLAVAGLGWLWGLQFPVIKKIWTSSYVLVAAGYSAMLLGVFTMSWMSGRSAPGASRSYGWA